MSDSNSNRKTAARQANQEQPSHYGLARANFSEGLHKSAVKYGEISQRSNPHTWKDAAAQTGQAALAGGKAYGKSAYHAGMGFMEGVSKQNQNSGQQLNNMKISQSIAQGRYQQDKMSLANQVRQNSSYSPKANYTNQQKASQPAANKGIEAAWQKAQANKSATSSGKSTNKGIESFHNKASGQSTGSSTNSASAGKSSSNGQAR
jgi:hypothetical protein